MVERVTNCRLKVGNTAKATSAQAATGQIGEQALDHVEPGRGGRRDVHMEAWMALKPAPHGGMLVSSVIVGNQMHRQMSRGFAGAALRVAIDLVQKPDELLMPVTLGTLTQNPPGLDVERGE